MHGCFFIAHVILSRRSVFILHGKINLFAISKKLVGELGQKEENLNATNDRKPRKESHGASNEAELGLCLDLLVPLNVVKGGRVKEDTDESKV